MNNLDKPPFFGRLSRKSSTNSHKGDNLYNASSDDKSGAALLDGNPDTPKSQSEGQLNGSTANDRFVFGSDGAGSFVNQLNEIGGHNADQATVQVQELVIDESLNDLDMKIEESFDAETEIKLIFPNISDTSNKKRLIVLLEFYHKTRYILMNLKRFKYILVNKWPQSQEFYFKALSLDCISPFVNLIKSLVTTIEHCITDQDFVGLEQAIFNWLSDNNDLYLKEWVALSSNLCCTNSLHAVKALKQSTLRAIPELTNLLKAKFHKQVMIEELTQIRPLLISLPLIAKNIIKCLTKLEPQYSNELVIWKDVSVKMDYLCEYIDRCSIPLVDWINDGSISKRPESFDDFCNDFPRTLFHYPIFDFQIAKILNWYTNAKTVGSYVQTNYFKRGTEVFLIFYQRFIAVLQKDNDHWMLKPIKAVTNTIERRYPIIEIGKDQVWNRGAQEDNSYVINIISQKSDTPLLIRIGFSRVEVVDSWLDFVNTKEYSLARSISLFKSTDVAQMIKSAPQFDRTPSMVSNKSKAASDVFESISMTNSIHERGGVPSMDNIQTQTANYMALYNKLTTASTALDCNPLLGAILNVPGDSIPNQIKTFRENGISVTDELTALLCNISRTLVYNTQQLLAKSCAKIEHESEFNLAEVKSMFITTWHMLDKWEKSQELDEEMHSKVVLRTTSKYRRGYHCSVLCHCVNSVTGESDQMLSSDINCTVGDIVHEIIEESMKQVNCSEPDRDSYRYVPTNSLLLSNEYYDVTSNGHITPATTILCNADDVIEHHSPAPDIIVVTRPQIHHIHKQQFDSQ